MAFRVAFRAGRSETLISFLGSTSPELILANQFPDCKSQLLPLLVVGSFKITANPSLLVHKRKLGAVDEEIVRDRFILVVEHGELHPADAQRINIAFQAREEMPATLIQTSLL